MNSQLLPIIIISLALSSGCTPFYKMTSEVTVSEDYSERTFGTVIEDNSIESKAKINIQAASTELAEAHINLLSFNRVLLITGQVQNESLKNTVSDITGKIRHVRRVHNELELRGPTPLQTRLHDFYLKTKIKSRLIATNGINSGRVTVIVENGKAYLMGLVTAGEANQIIGAVQKVSGLQKIVKALEYINSEADS